MIMRKIEKALYVAVALLIVWFAISFADVLAHNLSDMDYASWNVFEVIDKFR